MSEGGATPEIDKIWDGGKYNKILNPEKAAAAEQFDRSLIAAINLLITQEDVPSSISISDNMRKLLTNGEGKPYTRGQLYALEDFWRNLGSKRLDFSETPTLEDKQLITDGSRKFRSELDQSISDLLESKTINSAVITQLLMDKDGRPFDDDQLQAVKSFWGNLAEHETGVRNANLPPVASNHK